MQLFFFLKKKKVKHVKPECTRHFTIHLVSFTSVHTSHVHDVLGQAYKRRLIARQGDNFREISDQTHAFFFNQLHKYSWSVAEAL